MIIGNSLIIVHINDIMRSIVNTLITLQMSDIIKSLVTACEWHYEEFC